jgi:pyruvate,water dikinase
MTALPAEVSWAVPHAVPFVRHFRLGEWIGAPLTPLSESWLVTGLEEGAHRRVEALWGAPTPRPLHVMVNGWYFYGGLNFDMGDVWMWLKALPTILTNLPFHFREMMSTSAKPLGFHQEYARWQRDLLPAYRSAVSAADGAISSATPTALVGIVDTLVDAASVQFLSIIGVSGYGASGELDLMVFLQKHAPAEKRSVQELVVGGDATPAAHDVEGLDLVFPTLGERGALPAPIPADVRARVLARRDETEARVRDALPANRRKKFDALLHEARCGHVARQEQTGQFTLAWPALRRAVARLGEELARREVIGTADDIHFLSRAEVETALRGDHARPPVAERRATWERQRKLTPPLYVGQRTGLFKTIWDQIDALLHHEEHDAPDALTGHPGSPGRVSGVARVVLSVDELPRLKPGEILVAPVTTPAWGEAFSRALAVVTDAGSVASHASIVARERGIPAVVGTASGTRRIGDGQLITVDGSLGVVRGVQPL